MNSQIGFGAVLAQNPGFRAVLTGADGGRAAGLRDTDELQDEPEAHAELRHAQRLQKYNIQ